jgi:hypothetical protein
LNAWSSPLKPGSTRRTIEAAVVRLRREMTVLSTKSNFSDPAYRLIIEAHSGLNEAQSADLDAALVLVLADYIGDLEVLREAIGLAKRRMLEADQQQQQQQ